MHTHEHLGDVLETVRCNQVGTINMVSLAEDHKTPNSPTRHFETEHTQGLETFIHTMEGLKGGTTVHRQAQIARSSRKLPNGKTAAFMITLPDTMSEDDISDAALALVERTVLHLNPMPAKFIKESMAQHSEVAPFHGAQQN